MSRIKLNDLPQDAQISKEEMKKVFGGLTKALSQEINSFVNVKSGLTMPWVSISEGKCYSCDDNSVGITSIRTNLISQR